MLGGQDIILFPDARKVIPDEMPLFTVLFDDIKNIEQLQLNKEKQKLKTLRNRKSKLDTGIPHADNSDVSGAGLNCDATHFRNNV